MSNRSVKSSSSSQNRLRKPRPPPVKVPEPVHWLFRTNIPRRRASFIPASPGRRNFFGMGEIVGVLSNPASTVRSLTESKRLLEEARREIQETRERSQIRPTHTCSRLPNFFARKNEQQAIQRALEGEPSFTVLFGPASAGKTALLREILSHPRYHVLHFDLRIAGFADLESLYLSLSTQMEGFFEEIAQNGGWYEEGSITKIQLSEGELECEGWNMFDREAWGFKYDRISLERRIGGNGIEGNGGKGGVRPSDIARLMELFQSSLLRYREFHPSTNRKPGRRRNSEDTVVGGSQNASSTSKKRWWFSKRVPSSQGKVTEEPTRQTSPVDEEQKRKRQKRVPVIFFDEAHKLPHLIPSTQTMQTILDSTLVLTKQDRLCHVVHATSDPFYQGWLSRVGVLWYCKMIAIGDLSKSEMRLYYNERVQPRLATLPPTVKRLDFETLYDAFGGKVAHWYDFVTDHVNSGGVIGIKQSSHFLQAHALLNLHIIHSSQAPGGGFDGSPSGGGGNTTIGSIHGANAAANISTEAHRASPETVLHPGLGAAGFRMYQQQQGTHQAGLSLGSNVNPLQFSMNPLIASFTPYDGVGSQPEFSPMQLLKVMSRFTSGGLGYLPYFHLCRELGARAVDGMIRGKVVDVKWMDAVAPSVVDASRAGQTGGSVAATATNTSGVARQAGFHAQERTLVQEASGGMMRSTIEFGSNPPPPPPPPGQPPPPFTEEDEVEIMVPISDDEAHRGQQPHSAIEQSQSRSQSRTQSQIQFQLQSHSQPNSQTHSQSQTHLNHPHAAHSRTHLQTNHVHGHGSSTASFTPQYDEGYHEGDIGMIQEDQTHDPVEQYAHYEPERYVQYPPYHQQQDQDELEGDEEEEEEVIGPKIVPVSPIMRYAMREVIKEYEDDQSVSEYASLSDVDEY